MDELTALRALALRLAGEQAAGAHVHLYAAGLPDTLPVDIPIPDHSDIIGAIVVDQRPGAPSYSPPQTRIFLDTPLSPLQIRAFYQDRLRAAGWTPTPSFLPPGGGFGAGMDEGSEPNGVSDLFCRSQYGPSLSVNAGRVQEAPTQVLLQLDTEARLWVCAPVEEPPSRTTFRRLPPLLLPPGARPLRSWGDGSSGNGEDTSSARSMTAIETGLDQQAVMAHCETQLETSGWVKQESRRDGPLTWSRWTSRGTDGEPWRGLLYVLALPDAAHRYMLRLESEWVGNP